MEQKNYIASRKASNLSKKSNSRSKSRRSKQVSKRTSMINGIVSMGSLPTIHALNDQGMIRSGSTNILYNASDHPSHHAKQPLLNNFTDL